MRIKDSRLKSFQNKKLLDFFVAGIPDRTADELVGVNRNTANLFYNKLRLIIVHFTEWESLFLHGEVEVDESYFGGSAKDNEDAGLPGKFLSSVAPNAKAKFIH